MPTPTATRTRTPQPPRTRAGSGMTPRSHARSAPGRRRKRAALTRSLTITINVVAIDSNYEPVTKAAFDYREKHVYPYLISKGFVVERRQGNMARRVYTAPACRRVETDYITGVGHGLYDMYTGDYGDVILHVGNYDGEEVSARIIHFLSCQTAGQLGPDMVAKGCRAYFGYDENFTFHFDYADVFFECDSEIDRALADNFTAGQVHTRVIALFDQHIAKLRQQGHDYIAATLEFDRDHLKTPGVDPIFGDTSARLL